MLLACYSHQHISYRIRTIIRKAILLTNVNPEEIRPLSEENFCQFLLSVFKEVREKKLANKENVKNVEIKKLVADCVADIRGTEAKDSLIKLVGLPLGIKIDPKNISDSCMSGLKEKIPFLYQFPLCKEQIDNNVKEVILK